MKTSRIKAAVLVALVSSSVPLTASAEDDPVTTQARARFKEGVNFYDKGSYENARLAFLQAYALKKHPAVLLNLAQSSAKAGHPLEAARSFQQYLKESTSPQQRQDAEAGLAEVRQKLGRIDVVAPAGTEITLDENERLGTTPFAEPIDVEPGAHSLRSSNETVRVTANAGQKVQARFGTSASALAHVPMTGPGGPAASDGAPPPAAVPPDADKGGGLKKPLPMLPGYIAIGAAGVGIASAIIFAAFKADAQSKADSVDREIRDKAGTRAPGICTSTARDDVARFGAACATLKQNYDKVDTNATIANVGIGVAVVSGVFAAAWLIAVPAVNRNRKHAVNHPVLTPYAGANGAGFELEGSF
jgi:hypothetical protein